MPSFISSCCSDIEMLEGYTRSHTNITRLVYESFWFTTQRTSLFAFWVFHFWYCKTLVHYAEIWMCFCACLTIPRFVLKEPIAPSTVVHQSHHCQGQPTDIRVGKHLGVLCQGKVSRLTFTLQRDWVKLAGWQNTASTPDHFPTIRHKHSMQY